MYVHLIGAERAEQLAGERQEDRLSVVGAVGQQRQPAHAGEQRVSAVAIRGWRSQGRSVLVHLHSCNVPPFAASERSFSCHDFIVSFESALEVRRCAAATGRKPTRKCSFSR